MTDWTTPSADILGSADPSPGTADHAATAATIVATLGHFGIRSEVSRWDSGPVVTRYEVEPAPGVKVSRITRLADDLALALAATSLRIEAPIPGRHALGIEVPNARAETVTLGASPVPADAPPLTFALGAAVDGTVRTCDLATTPHLLIAGATGSGKSVMVNALVSGLLLRNTPDTLRLILVDLKRVELAAYNGVPHLLCPVITEPADALSALRWAVGEMERRYRLLAAAGVRNVAGYNAAALEGNCGRSTAVSACAPLPYVVIVIDELADLMIRGRDVETPIVRLAQKARAIGIHLVLATQRPSVNVITGLIKANFPARIAFAMTSNIDSRTILDTAGAEDLIGRGDMLYQPSSQPRPVRLQGVYVSDREIDTVAAHWRRQGASELVDMTPVEDVEHGTPEPTDPLFEDAARVVSEYRSATASLLQRRLNVDYSRAYVILAQLVAAGKVREDGSVVREPARHWWSR